MKEKTRVGYYVIKLFALAEDGMRKRRRCLIGRAITQAVSHWFPTVAARVRARVWSYGIVVDKAALGQVFSEYFSFT
jgi:hypothetical protein